MLGLLMLAGLDLARHFRHVLRPERRSGGNRASREQDGSGVQTLPGSIPCGDIKFQRFLVFFVNFHWHTPRIRLGTSLSKAGQGQKIDSRECSVRYGNIRHQNSAFILMVPTRFKTHNERHNGTPPAGAGRGVSHGCAEGELDVTCLRPSYFHEVTNEG